MGVFCLGIFGGSPVALGVSGYICGATVPLVASGDFRGPRSSPGWGALG